MYAASSWMEKATAYLAEGGDLVVRSWVLSRKLIRRESEHDQPSVRKLLVQLLEARELSVSRHAISDLLRDALVVCSRCRQRRRRGCRQISHHFDAVFTINVTLPLSSFCRQSQGDQSSYGKHRRTKSKSPLVPGKLAFRSKKLCWPRAGSIDSLKKPEIVLRRLTIVRRWQYVCGRTRRAAMMADGCCCRGLYISNQRTMRRMECEDGRMGRRIDNNLLSGD